MSKRFSIAEARNRLPSLVHAVEDGPPVELTRRGKPVAALVSIRDLHRISGERPSFMAALKEFRESTDLSLFDDIDEIFEGVRDRSPGREVDL